MKIKFLTKTNMVKKSFSILAAFVLSFGWLLVIPARAACAQSAPSMTVVEQVNDGSSGWTKNLTTQGGRTVQFELQIHNTVVGSQAIGVRAQAVLPSGSSTSFNVPVTVSAQNAGGAGDSVTINIPSGGSIAYVPGSTRLTWSPDGNGTYPYNNSPIQDGITTGSLPAFGDQSGCTNFIIRVDFLATISGSYVPPTVTTTYVPVQPPTQTIVVPAPIQPTQTIIQPVPGPTQTIVQQVPGPTQTVVQQVPGPTQTIVQQVPGPTQTIVQQVPGPTRVVQASAPVPTKTPATGPEVVTLAGMFGVGPIGFALSRYGRGLKAFEKREEDWMGIAKDAFLNRKIKKM